MLKVKRVEAGMSQRELAAKSGVPLRTLQNWERDVSQASVGSLKRVADTLGCKVDDLL